MKNDYKAEAWYTGGGIWVAVKNIDEMHYVATDNAEFENALCYYDRQIDIDEGYEDEEYGFYGCIEVIELNAMTKEERKLYDEVRTELMKEINKHSSLAEGQRS